MRYINFGSTGKKISALGFGAMRLPVIDKDETRIDIPNALEMLHFAYDNGINYVDTAYPYHGGNREYIVGESLRTGYREKVYLADKLTTWLIESHEALDKIFSEQLKKLGTDHIDFYLLHSLYARLIFDSLKKEIVDYQ